MAAGHIVRSRLRGFAATQALTVTFLDAHVECTIGWLEPLLDRIATNASIIAAPQIDLIHPLTFAYVVAGGHMRGGFDWSLNFRWVPPARGTLAQRAYPSSSPVSTPAIAGGLFTVGRAWFERIGTYDASFEVWGSEKCVRAGRIFAYRSMAHFSSLGALSGPLGSQFGARVLRFVAAPICVPDSRIQQHLGTFFVCII